MTVNHLTQLKVKDLWSFLTRFDVAMGRVEDCTENEASKRFWQALPPKHQKEILNEQARKNQKKNWVKWNKPTNFTLLEVETFVSQFLERPTRVEEDLF